MVVILGLKEHVLNLAPALQSICKALKGTMTLQHLAQLDGIRLITTLQTIRYTKYGQEHVINLVATNTSRFQSTTFVVTHTPTASAKI